MIKGARFAKSSVCRVRQAVLRSEEPGDVRSTAGSCGPGAHCPSAANAAGLSVLGVGTSHFQDKIHI